MLLNQKYPEDDAFFKSDNKISEIYGKHNNAAQSGVEDSGDGKAVMGRLSSVGPARKVETTQHTPACPWPKTCGCCNK